MTCARKICSIFEWILIAAALFITVSRIIHAAETFDYSSIDEIVNVQAAFSLLTTGNYTSNILSGIFPPSITSGIVTTWPAGLNFVLGGNIFTARILQGILILIQVIGIGIIFLANYDLSLRKRLLFVCSICIMAFFLTPAWGGFLASLGEFSGSLMLVWALLFLEKHPALAGLCLGAAAWGCKFMYAPCAVFLIVIYSTFNTKHPSEKLRLALILTTTFLLPLLAWMGLIALKFGLSAPLDWWQAFCGNIIGNHSGIDGRIRIPILERFNSPILSWQGLALTEKVFILGCFLMPFMFSGWLMISKEWMKFSERTRALIWSGLASIAFLAAWYLFKSPTMWLRHAQPGMYVGLIFLFGLGVHCHLTCWQSRPNLRIMLRIMLAISLLSYIFSSLRIFPLLYEIPGHGEECTDVFSPRCLAEGEHLE